MCIRRILGSFLVILLPKTAVWRNEKTNQNPIRCLSRSTTAVASFRLKLNMNCSYRTRAFSIKDDIPSFGVIHGFELRLTMSSLVTRWLGSVKDCGLFWSVPVNPDHVFVLSHFCVHLVGVCTTKIRVSLVIILPTLLGGIILCWLSNAPEERIHENQVCFESNPHCANNLSVRCVKMLAHLLWTHSLYFPWSESGSQLSRWRIREFPREMC